MTKFLSDFIKKLSTIPYWLFNLPVTRFVARAICRLLKPRRDVLIHVHGYKMYANTVDRLTALILWKLSALEDYEASFLSQLVRPGAVTVDIGANIGYHTIHLSKLAGERGKVYAFEPDPENYRLLLKNLKANDCANTVAHQKAVTDKNGHINLFFCEEHRGDHRIFDSHDGRKQLEIEAVALDDFLKDALRVDFIKMDIQGAEYLALQGMKEVLKRNPDITMVCEFDPDLLNLSNASAAQFIAEITDLGFNIFILDTRKKQTLKIAPQELLHQIKGHQYTNLFLSRKDAPFSA